jgi:hypothetical protein
MKLYTEEQLKEFFKEHYFFMERDLDNLTPIELPTDDEIEKAYEFSGPWTAKEIMQKSTSFQDGANWIINHIKQQDNGK